MGGLKKRGNIKRKLTPSVKADIKKMTRMRIKGATLEKIGRAFRLSRQRVYQRLMTAHGTANLSRPQTEGEDEPRSEIAALETSLKIQRARLDTIRKEGIPWEVEELQETIASLEGRLKDATRVTSVRKNDNYGTD